MDDGWNISLSNIPGIYLSPTHTSRSVWHWRLYFSCTLNCFAVPQRGFFFFFLLLWSGVILPFYGVYIIASLSLSFSHHSLNGSLPSNVEIKNNTLFFKGPVTYDLAGTYVCDATNGIGTRTGIVDVNITGRLMKPVLSVSLSSSVTPAWLASIQYPAANVARARQTPIHPNKHTVSMCSHRPADCSRLPVCFPSGSHLPRLCGSLLHRVAG